MLENRELYLSRAPQCCQSPGTGLVACYCVLHLSGSEPADCPIIQYRIRGLPAGSLPAFQVWAGFARLRELETSSTTEGVTKPSRGCFSPVFAICSMVQLKFWGAIAVVAVTPQPVASNSSCRLIPSKKQQNQTTRGFLYKAWFHVTFHGVTFSLRLRRYKYSPN